MTSFLYTVKKKRKVLSPIVLRRTFPNLQISKLSHTEIKKKLPKLYLESSELCCKFNKLCKVLLQSLKARSILKKQLVTCVLGLKTLPPVFKTSNLPLFKDQKSNLLVAEDLDDVWIILDDYYSYFNYYIVELISDDLGTEDDKQQMSSYKKDFATYMKRRLYECPAEFGPMNNSDCTIIVKLDKTYDDCTADQLVILTHKLCEIFRITPDGVLRLCTVKQGCYELTYQTPAFIQDTVFPLSPEQEAALKDLKVIWLLCGDYELSSPQDVSNENMHSINLLLAISFQLIIDNQYSDDDEDTDDYPG